jgi:hypothetical protein
MTLGVAAAAGVRLIVWCKECRHQIEPDPAEMATRYGAETSVLDWRDRLVCSRCGGRQVDMGDRNEAMTAKVFEDRQWPGDWRVDWIDEDGGIEVILFSGPECAGTTGSFGSFQYPGQVPLPAPSQSIVAREAIGGWEFATPSSLRLDLGERPP